MFFDVVWNSTNPIHKRHRIFVTRTRINSTVTRNFMSSPSLARSLYRPFLGRLLRHSQKTSHLRLQAPTSDASAAFHQITNPAETDEPEHLMYLRQPDFRLFFRARSNSLTILGQNLSPPLTLSLPGDGVQCPTFCTSVGLNELE